jgi:hypothetical protein
VTRVGIQAAVAAFTAYLLLLNNFLRFEQYPFFRLEVLITVSIGAAAAALFGLAYQAGNMLPPVACRLSRAALIAALVAYGFALITTEAYTLLAAAIAATLSLLYGSRILAVLSMLAVMTIASSSLGLGQQTEEPFVSSGKVRPSSGTSPAIVHIILDEHIGLEGLPTGSATTPGLKQALHRFYVENGFKLFGGAYSRNFKTIRSIPFVLNFGLSRNLGDSEPLKDNLYLKSLRQSGYRINVLQSQYLNFCSRLVDSCTTYRSHNYAVVARSDMSAGAKAVLIVSRLIPPKIGNAIAWAYQRIGETGDRLPIRVPITALTPTPLNGLAALRLFQEQVAVAEPATVYFAHILLPHNPYLLRSDCSVASVADWRLGDLGRGEPLSERQAAYAQQTYCALLAVRGVLNSLAKSPVGRNSVVIIHGDHGSRIGDVEPIFENVAHVNDEALLANYSTLFAVRAPGITPGYEARHYAIADLLREFVRSDFRSIGAYPPTQPEVILRDKQLRARRMIPLPKQW